jgi:hypothetical protein
MAFGEEMEMSRLRSETNLRAYSARDKMAEQDMKQQVHGIHYMI